MRHALPRLRAISITSLRLANAAVLAAVLCVAVRSYWVQDFVRLPDGWLRPAVWVKSGGGELLVQVFWYRETKSRQAEWRVVDNDGASYLSDDVAYHALGFGLDLHRLWPTVVLPWWAIAMPLSVWPIWWLLWDRMRWRRRRAGRCVGCGYDLRETTGRACPECGRAVAPPRRAEPARAG